jgi:nitroreductase
MAAPTAVNKQPWAFVAIDNREDLDSLAAVLPYARMLSSAPLAIVTCADLSKAIESETAERGFWIQDVSAATENLLLAAHALGLGAVWTGVYPDADRVKAVQQRLGMPDSIIPLAVVPVGYPAGEQTHKEKWNPENVHFNRW